MSPSEIAAWWGAVIATLVFLWELYKKWQEGPKLRVTVNTNMIFIGDAAREGQRFITVRAVNIGDASTTVTNLGGNYYRSVWTRLLRRPEQSFVVARAGTTQPLPYKLEPGSIWDGSVKQDPNVEQWARSGHLMLAVYQAGRNPVTRRVVIKASSPEPEEASSA
jgi:hypothetical protein